MQVHLYRRPWPVGRPFVLFLCSDVHWGASACDEKRFIADLDAAVAAGARVVINGDVFDAIGHGDKRYTPSVLAKRFRGVDDLAHALVADLAGVLAPYAPHIDVVGIGNHEEAWLKYRLGDPVRELLALLNAGLERAGHAHRIRHGGISGFYRTTFAIEGGGAVNHTLLYLHGAGGDSPVTKGTIDFNRRLVSFEADAVTFGHKHNSLHFPTQVCYLSPRGHVREKTVQCIQTGSYYRNLAYTGQKRPAEYSYAESKQHAPKPIGGAYLILTPERHALPRHGREPGTGGTTLWRIRQDYATYLPPAVPPPPAA